MNEQIQAPQTYPMPIKSIEALIAWYSACAEIDADALALTHMEKLIRKDERSKILRAALRPVLEGPRIVRDPAPVGSVS